MAASRIEPGVCAVPRSNVPDATTRIGRYDMVILSSPNVSSGAIRSSFSAALRKKPRGARQVVLDLRGGWSASNLSRREAVDESFLLTEMRPAIAGVVGGKHTVHRH